LPCVSLYTFTYLFIILQNITCSSILYIFCLGPFAYRPFFIIQRNRDLKLMLHWYLSVLLLFFFWPLVTNFSNCHLSRVLVFLFLLLWSALSSKPLLLFFSFVVSFSRPIICSFSIPYIVIMTNDLYSENYKRSLDQHIINKLSIIYLNFSCLHFDLYLSYSDII
jgi:hypothetical protein